MDACLCRLARFAVASFVSFPAALFAQGLLLQSSSQSPLQPVQVVRTAIHGEIVDGVATTVIDQVFANRGASDAEGTWILPLPRGAVADGFTMTVGGKEVRAETLDSNHARNVYEAIVRQRRDPGLLEFAGEGLLRARIFPIPAHGEVGVTVRLRQVLEPLAGLYQWQWPLRSMQMGDAGIGSLSLDVSIKTGAALATVFSPLGGAEVRREGECKAMVTLEGAFAQLDNLEVYYGLAQQEFGLHLLTHRPTGQDGYFAMLVSPPRTLPDGREPPRRCVQFVVDTSGSMQGAKLAQAKAAVKAFLGTLRQMDHFQVVAFASAVQPFFPVPVAATAENLAAATAKVDALTALGGTNISGALQQAFETAMPSSELAAYLPQVVFVTDGEPTMGIINPQQILELCKKTDARAMRLFALGVGDQLDVRLLDDLVLQHHGARDFVSSKENIEVKVSALCAKLAQPALTDVVVRCDGVEVFDVMPNSTHDLFCGEQLQITGRYRGDGAKRVVVTGNQSGKAREFLFEVAFPAVAPEREFVQTLWARQQVAALLDGIRRNGQKPELMSELRRIASQYGIVTPYTSQLIVEEGVRLGGRVGDWRSGPATGAAPAPEDRLKHLGQARSGEAAIADSKAAEGKDEYHLGATRRLRGGGKAGQAEPQLPAEEEETVAANGAVVARRACGRTFLPVGADLVEQGLPAQWREAAVAIELFSDAYFALLKANPSLTAILALGERIAFRDGERIVHIQPAAK